MYHYPILVRAYTDELEIGVPNCKMMLINHKAKNMRPFKYFMSHFRRLFAPLHPLARRPRDYHPSPFFELYKKCVCYSPQQVLRKLRKKPDKYLIFLLNFFRFIYEVSRGFA